MLVSWFGVKGLVMPEVEIEGDSRDFSNVDHPGVTPNRELSQYGRFELLVDGLASLTETGEKQAYRTSALSSTDLVCPSVVHGRDCDVKYVHTIIAIDVSIRFPSST